MSATVDQIAARIYRISTYVPDAGPSGEQRYGCRQVDLPAQALPAHGAPVGVSS